MSHFSFWNCDYPASYIHFDCTVVDASGHPIQNAWVEITIISDPTHTRGGYTDSSGYVGGLVPDNQQLLLEVFNDYGCSTNNIYSQTITTTSSPLSLGNIIVAGSSLSTITGTLTDCSGLPVTNGYIIMQNGYQYFRSAVTNGNFTITTPVCGSNNIVNFIGQDNNSMQEGTLNNYTLLNGNNNIGNIQACGTSTQQFINYTINTVNYSFTAPGDSIYQRYFQTPPPNITNGVAAFNYGAGIYSNADLSYIGAAMGVGLPQTLGYFNCSQVSDSMVVTTPIPVNITEYGNAGQFIAGNFTGTLTGLPPANTQYNITCSFRYRRQY